jgi:hypothetical protein
MATSSQRSRQKMSVHFQAPGEGLGDWMLEMSDEANAHPISGPQARKGGRREAIPDIS